MSLFDEFRKKHPTGDHPTEGFLAWMESELEITRHQLAIARAALESMRDCPDYHIEDIACEALDAIAKADQ